MTNLFAAIVVTLATNFTETVTERGPAVPLYEVSCGSTNCAQCYRPGPPIAKDVTRTVTEVTTGTIGDWSGETRKLVSVTNYQARLEWVNYTKLDPFQLLTNSLVVTRMLYSTNAILGYGMSNRYHIRSFVVPR